ncbi:hypothetical protein H2198_003595 [Neophaeococcomyces mojaviensis]|uniref:Uncharacterized protein n=1 Tax=Neophaeococcomyces mojaviensis TaxID=3383035 RepID=A0ACC3AAW3_9EURO|nr:hypothetical protein H2198_003595 [Knufia sp. JES_112]
MQPKGIVDCGRGLYQMGFNAYALRRFLNIVGYSKQDISVKNHLSTLSKNVETLHWEDEPTATYTLGYVDQVQALYRSESAPHFQSQVTLSISQIYQILQSSRMDLTVETLPSFTPMPLGKI